MVAASIPGALVLGLLLFRPTLARPAQVALARPFLLCVSLLIASLAAEAACDLAIPAASLQRACRSAAFSGRHAPRRRIRGSAPGRGRHPPDRFPRSAGRPRNRSGHPGRIERRGCSLQQLALDRQHPDLEDVTGDPGSTDPPAGHRAIGRYAGMAAPRAREPSATSRSPDHLLWSQRVLRRAWRSRATSHLLLRRMAADHLGHARGTDRAVLSRVRPDP